MGMMLIAGLGNMAGGVAGSMLKKLFEPNPLQVDTSIPGVSKAVLQKGGKNNAELAAAQLDPTDAIGYFKQAAENNEKYIMQGLNIYSQSIAQAADAITMSTRSSNATLSGLSGRSELAGNEYLKMLGLAPPTSMTTNRLIADVQSMGFGDAANLMQQNEAIQDPYERAAARAKVESLLNSQASTVSAEEREQLMNGIKMGLGAPPVLQESKLPETITRKGKTKTNLNRIDENRRFQAKYDQEMAIYNGKLNEAYDRQAAQLIADQKTQAKDIMSQYGRQYGDEPERGYTQGEVQEKIEATPGYQFQMTQGLRAAERSAAARGTLQSGNTLTALNDYAQGQASSYYQKYMDNLMGIAQQGAGATQQTAQNEYNLGQGLANLSTLAGQAYLTGLTNIGNTNAAALNNIGQATYNAAAKNVDIQNATLESKRARDAAARMNNTSTGPAYMNAVTEQQRFQYGVFQNQQGGQVYQSQMNNSGKMSL